MKLNENLTLEGCLEMLNEMAQDIVDQQSSGDEIEYVIVDLKHEAIIEKCYKGIGLGYYLNEYELSIEDDEGIDIAPLWSDINGRFNTNIVLSPDNEFYIEEN